MSVRLKIIRYSFKQCISLQFSSIILISSAQLGAKSTLFEIISSIKQEAHGDYWHAHKEHHSGALVAADAWAHITYQAKNNRSRQKAKNVVANVSN